MQSRRLASAGMRNETARKVAEHVRTADHHEEDAAEVVTEAEIDEVEKDHKRVVRLFKYEKMEEARIQDMMDGGEQPEPQSCWTQVTWG